MANKKGFSFLIVCGIGGFKDFKKMLADWRYTCAAVLIL